MIWTISPVPIEHNFLLLVEVPPLVVTLCYVSSCFWELSVCEFEHISDMRGNREIICMCVIVHRVLRMWGVISLKNDRKKNTYSACFFGVVRFICQQNVYDVGLNYICMNVVKWYFCFSLSNTFWYIEGGERARSDRVDVSLAQVLILNSKKSQIPKTALSAADVSLLFFWWDSHSSSGGGCWLFLFVVVVVVVEDHAQ